MWFLRKATGTVLHNLELLFRGKKKSELLVSSSLNEFDLMALYLILIATGKRNCLYWKIPRLESRLTTGSFFHLFRWRWPAEPGCCVVGFRTLCAHVFERFSDAKSVTNYSSIQKSELQLDLATFSRSNSFPLYPKRENYFQVWKKTQKHKLQNHVISKKSHRHCFT